MAVKYSLQILRAIFRTEQKENNLKYTAINHDLIII